VSSLNILSPSFPHQKPAKTTTDKSAKFKFKIFPPLSVSSFCSKVVYPGPWTLSKDVEPKPNLSSLSSETNVSSILGLSVFCFRRFFGFFWPSSSVDPVCAVVCGFSVLDLTETFQRSTTGCK